VDQLVALSPGQQGADMVGAWTHIAVALDRGANLAWVFVNGVRQPTSVNIAALTGSLASPAPLVFANTGALVFDGQVAELAVFPFALTDAQAHGIFAAAGQVGYPAAVLSAGPVGYWRLGETSGTLTRTNLATNPSMETASGTVVARRNLATGNLATANNWFTLSAPLTVTNGVSYNGQTWTRGSNTSGSSEMRRYVSLGDLVNAKSYIATMLVHNEGAASLPLTLDWCDIGGASYTLAPGETRRISTVLASRATYDATYRFADIQMTAPGSLLVSDVLIEQAAAAGPVGTYFDGNTPAAGDFTYAWAGAANASASTQMAPNVVDVVGANATVTRDSTWATSGTRSAQVVPSGASSDSFASVGGDSGAVRLGMVPGQRYTISADIHLAGPATGTLDGRGRAVVVYYNRPSTGYVATIGTVAPNSAGTFRSTATVTIPSDVTEAFVRLYNGSNAAADAVWWDSILVEPSTTAGAYFDGSSVGATWTGAADASTSTWTTGNGTVAVNAVGTPDGTYTGALTLGNAGLSAATSPTVVTYGTGGTVALTGVPADTSAGGVNTVEMWVKPGDGTNQMLFGFTSDGLWNYGGNLGFSTGSGDLYGTSTPGDWAGVVHHVVAVMANNGPAGNELYIDGVAQVLTQRVGTTGARAADTSLNLSGWPSGGYTLDGGSMADVALYNVALTPAQVLAHYIAGK